MPQRSAYALVSARQGGFWFQLKSQKSRLTVPIWVIALK
jgi:hypothetical protein